MKVKFNLTGTNVHKGFLEVRFDLFPAVTDRSYPLYYVDVLDKKTELPTGVKQLNPVLCHFIRVPETFQIPDLQEYLAGLFNRNAWATIDYYMTLADSLHYIGPYMRGKTPFPAAKIQTADTVDLIASINRSPLKDLVYEMNLAGGIETLTHQTIDIGPGATNRAGRQAGNTTKIDLGNAANANGTISTWEVWYITDAGAGVLCGTFSGADTTYTNRDYDTVGDAASGSKTTVTGKSTDVVAGDFAGVWEDSGTIERDTSGGAGIYVNNDNQMGTGAQSYTLSANYAISVYGEGTEAGAGWAHKFNGVANASISKINGIAKASISKVNGVA